MTKALLFADAHIAQHKRSTDRMNDCVEALRWTLQTAVDNNIKHVLFAGDLFHDRQKIDVLTYQKTFEVFEQFLCGESQLEVFLLMGNHDMFHFQRWDVSSLNPLRQLPGVVVVDKPCSLMVGTQLVGFLPYTHDPIKDVEVVKEDWLKNHKKLSLKQTMPKVLVGHVAIDGAVWNIKFGTTSEVTIEHDGDMMVVGPEIFDWWDRVWLGHYHAEQKLTNRIEYLGSPLQLSFGEAFQKKHILIYDFIKKKSEYIENTFSPKHLIIKESELNDYDLEGNFVQVVVENITSPEILNMQRDLIGNKKVGSVEVKQSPRNEDHVVKDAKAILLREGEMLQEYVNQVNPENLDKSHLLTIGKKICEESGNE